MSSPRKGWSVRPNPRPKPATPDHGLLAAEGWLALDTETTGRGDGAEVVEVAVVDADGTVLFDSVIRPTRRISAGAERLHGLTAERLSAAPSFAAVYDEVRALIADRAVIAYHAPFDRRVLKTSCLRAGLAEIPATWICALDYYESLRGFRPSLHVACEIESVDGPTQSHRAAADALALQRLIARLREPKSPLGVRQIC
ncbi:MAG: 3'-5' exonuclease [Thermoanaerobaculia bacterium]